MNVKTPEGDLDFSSHLSARFYEGFSPFLFWINAKTSFSICQSGRGSPSRAQMEGYTVIYAKIPINLVDQLKITLKLFIINLQ